MLDWSTLKGWSTGFTAADVGPAPLFPAVGPDQHNIHQHCSAPAVAGLHMQKVELKSKVMAQIAEHITLMGKVW